MNANEQKAIKAPPAFPPLGFSEADVRQAAGEWGCNCGPAAIAAVLGWSLVSIRSYLGDFEKKRYTNPSLMFQILDSLPQHLAWSRCRPDRWATYGLVRIQWGGPWMKGPVRARYRKTHWVASRKTLFGTEIFDVNAMHAGGWIAEETWERMLVPHILATCVPGNDGTRSRTHRLEILSLLPLIPNP